MVGKLRQRERGVALLAVMMAIALITLIVVDFATTVVFARLSASNQANELRAYYLARSAIAVGLGLLAEDERNKQATPSPTGVGGGSQPDSLVDVWALPFPPMQVDGGTINLAVVDEARKIDINGLIDPQKGDINAVQLGIITRLFALLGINPQIIPSIVQWILPASAQGLLGGAGLDFYMQLRPPYSPRFSPMPTIGDLKMIAGIDEPTFLKLQPFVTVQKETGINVNTASPEVLEAAEPEFAEDPQLVKAIVLARTISPFAKLTDVQNLLGGATFQTPLAQVITTTSVYFTISGMGSYAGSRKLVHGVFERQPGAPSILMSWQED
ncbi:MAG TPA: type II secretion system minor pseudopilin GspK [Candidatus Binataceae bacterium]|nr:type II secretion system minor pseudopilin GspK [Candidatus Binataceae bacterium]